MKFKGVMALAALTMVSACNKAEAPKADDAAAKPEATSTAAVDTGVPECDQYVSKMMACVKDKMPEAQRKMVEDSLAQSKAAWAGIPDKTQLAAQCKAAMDQAKTTYSAAGCSF